MAYSKNPRLIGKETGAGLLLFNTETGRMMELNSTARLLWEETGESFGYDELLGIIEKRCEGAEGAEKDIRRFIEAARKHELVSGDG